MNTVHFDFSIISINDIKNPEMPVASIADLKLADIWIRSITKKVVKKSKDLYIVNNGFDEFNINLQIKNENVVTIKLNGTTTSIMRIITSLNKFKKLGLYIYDNLNKSELSKNDYKEVLIEKVLSVASLKNIYGDIFFKCDDFDEFLKIYPTIMAQIKDRSINIQSGNHSTGTYIKYSGEKYFGLNLSDKSELNAYSQLIQYLQREILTLTDENLINREGKNIQIDEIEIYQVGKGILT